MRKLVISALCSSYLVVVSGQDLVERISLEICSCIDTIENMDSLESKLDRCIPESLALVWESEAPGDQDYLTTADTIKNTLDAVVGKLTFYCPKIREFILVDKEARYYRMSDSDLANELYLAGNKAFESDNLKAAAKKYAKAIKADKGWVYPYDNLALTCRNLGKYKKAVKYYDKSLEIYPEGSFALQNQAVAFTYINENMNALSNYNSLINLYPDNPEGYFGTAKVLFIIEEYEKALDYAFVTHKMYVSRGSDYVKDTEKLISSIHEKMKEQNKLDLFIEKAKAHGITINQVSNQS